MPTEYGYKKIPQFDPEHYQAWTSNAIRAFDERNWLPFLLGTNKPSDKATTEEIAEYEKAKKTPHAFLHASIPYAYMARVEDCTDAADLWSTLKREFGAFTAADEARLEAIVYDFRKSPTDTIDQHNTKFINLIAQITSKQLVKYPDSKINNLYMRSLELASIPNEDWRPFVTGLGETFDQISRQTLYAKAKSYYLQHIVGDGKQGNHHTPVDTNSIVQAAIKAYVAQQGRSQSPNPRHCSHCNKSGHTIDKCFQLHGYPKDRPFCTFCKRGGHTLEECRSKGKGTGTSGTPTPPAKDRGSYFYQGKVARVFTATDGPRSASEWLLDSGASDSMTWNHLVFQTYIEFDVPRPVHGISGEIVAHGKGSIVLLDRFGRRHEFHEVLYVPKLRDSIISKHWTKTNGLKTTLDDHENFVLTSPSGFTTTTASIDRLTMLQGIDAMPYDPSYELETSPSPSSTDELALSYRTTASTGNTNANAIWHQRLGHASDDRLRKAGIHVETHDCHDCIVGKQTRRPFKSIDKQIHAENKLHRIYMDICGPITPVSLGGNRYLLTITDEYTRYSWIFSLPDKKASSILSVVQPWQTMAENQSSSTVKIIHTDGGKEFTGVLADFCVSKGIQHDITTPYSPSSNGIAERMNRTIFDIVRPMMSKSGAPQSLWAEAASTAMYIRNRLPSRSINDLSPHEAWFGSKPELSHIRTFGCVCYAHITNPNTKKLDAKATYCCLLGYRGNHQYRVIDIDSGRIGYSRDGDTTVVEDKFVSPSEFHFINTLGTASQTLDVQFEDDDDDDDVDSELHETNPEDPTFPPTRAVQPQWPPLLPYMPVPAATVTPTPPVPHYTAPQVPHYPIPPVPRSVAPHVTTRTDAGITPRVDALHAPTRTDAGITPRVDVPHVVEDTAPSITPSTPRTPRTTPDPEPTPDPRPSRPSRSAKPSLKLREQQEGHAVAKTATINRLPLLATFTGLPLEPSSYREARTRPDWPQWDSAMKRELAALERHRTFTLVPELPAGRKLVDVKWVYKLKDADLPNPRYKARLVAKGFTQIAGVDYDETYSPVIMADSLRMLFAIAAALNMEIAQIDVENAFLNGLLKEEIYIRQPEGYSNIDATAEMVLRLLKALYGLKQSSNVWHKSFVTVIISFGYIRSTADDSLYVHADGSIIAIYVDDVLILARSTDHISHIIKSLEVFYALRDMGPAKRFLGIDIRRDPTGITINQRAYIDKFLERFGMTNCNPVKAPMDPSVKLIAATEDAELADREEYRTIVGTLSHLAVYTRPDIAYAVSKLAQFNQQPTTIHFQAAKHLIRYIAGTKDSSIHYNSPISPYYDSQIANHPIGYCDASYANDHGDKKSVSGWIFMVNGAPVAWLSKKQPVIAQSTMEAEYIAINQACRESYFIRHICSTLPIPEIEGPSQILTDSQPAVDHVRNNINHSKTKHIDIRYHYIRQEYENNRVTIQHIPAECQIADILTKALAPTAHAKALELLRLVSQ
jgi:transposase InsO family protein